MQTLQKDISQNPWHLSDIMIIISNIFQGEFSGQNILSYFLPLLLDPCQRQKYTPTACVSHRCGNLIQFSGEGHCFSFVEKRVE